MVTLEMTKYTVFIIVITLLFAGFILGYIHAALKMTKNPDGIFFVNLKDPNEEVMKQINNIYNSENRNWIDKIIIKKHNKVITIYERKKEVPPQPAIKP